METKKIVIENDVKDYNRKEETKLDEQKGKNLKENPILQSGFGKNKNIQKWENDGPTINENEEEKSIHKKIISEEPTVTSHFKSRFLSSTVNENPQKNTSKLKEKLKEEKKT